MKSRQFFYIFAAGLLLVISIWGFFIQPAIRLHRDSNVVNIPVENGIDLQAEIQTFEPIEGTDILRSPLYSKLDSSFTPSSYNAGIIQNYLFFNPNQKKFYWLKPIVKEGQIFETIALTEMPTVNLETKKAPPISFAYAIADKDTNDDKNINRSDQKQIAISDASGLRFKVLIEQVDRFNGSSFVKDNRVFLFYQLEKKLKVAEIDLRSQEIISNTEFSAQP